MDHPDDRHAKAKEIFKSVQVRELVDIDNVRPEMFACLHRSSFPGSAAEKEAVPEGVLPRSLAFTGAGAMKQADSMAALFEGGRGGEDVRLRAAEGAKLFVNK
jgi:hypothetical protein